jgi:hypothetical protein
LKIFCGVKRPAGAMKQNNVKRKSRKESFEDGKQTCVKKIMVSKHETCK